MSSPDAAHSKEGDNALGGTASEPSKADGAGNGTMTILSDRLGSLNNGGAEGEERMDAESTNEETSSTSNGQEGGCNIGQDNRPETGTKDITVSSGDEDTIITSNELQGSDIMELGNAHKAGIEVSTVASSREASSLARGGGGEEIRAAAAEKTQDASITSNEQGGGGSVEQESGSQHNPNQATRTSLAPPLPTVVIADTAIVKKVGHPDRNFAQYKLAPQTPAMASNSRGWGGEGGGGIRWKSGDGGRERSWGGGEGRDGGWRRTWGGGGQQNTGSGEERSGGGRIAWGGGGELRTGGGDGRGGDWGKTWGGGRERNMGGGEGHGGGWGRTWGGDRERNMGGGEGRGRGGGGTLDGGRERNMGGAEGRGGSWGRTWGGGTERGTGGGEGRGVGWERTCGGGGERNMGGGEGCGRSGARTWGDGGERNTANGYRRPPDWKEWLWKYLEVPRGEKQEKDVYYEDELCVVIYDGFPKAKYHLLLIAKNSSVKQPTDLRREHLPSRRRLHDVGRAIAEALSQQGAGAVRCGYHAIPSLEPLHMHIVSQDFDAPRLRRPSHWNSFTTDFFLDCSWVETRLEELGSLELDMNMYKRLKHQPMRCFRCGWAASGMPSIKKHNLECTAPLPGGAAESCSKSAWK